MEKKAAQIVISKEDAVFWLDKNGRWQNRHGPFEHKKIIDYFHRSIKKDPRGYYLSQSNGNVSEKVYFKYEDTALFVFDILFGEFITLVLNTGETIEFHPENLYIRNDNLYIDHNREKIKFSEQALIKISGHIDGESDRYFLNFSGTITRIPVRSDSGNSEY